MKKLICLFTILYLLTSCNKLNIAPNSIIQDKDIYTTPTGIQAYMAALYSYLPLEDFKYNPVLPAGAAEGDGGFNQFRIIENLNNYTGESHNWEILNEANASDNTRYWAAAYVLIRNATIFINTMPNYASSYTTAQVNGWIGEARFLRACTYFALVKRYGGVPLITTVATPDQLQLPRNSEQEVWDYVGTELTAATGLLPAKSENRGRANKYIAAGMLSRAMLYAGSIAKYNTINNVDAATGKRVQGIPTTEAVRYFKASYDAAVVVETGGYKLYRAQPDKAVNFYNLFFDISAANTEMIFAREYSDLNSVHSFDVFAVPLQMVGPNGYGSFFCPTLDWVELFDGLPRNPDGSLKTIDAATGKFAYYDDRLSFFKNAEPRLLGSVLVPGTTFKGQTIEVRRGIYTGSIANGISPFNGSLPPYPVVTSPYGGTTGVVGSTNKNGDPAVPLPGGGTLQAGGASGVFGSRDAGTSTGFFQRKFLDESKPTSLVASNRCFQPWMELRYAEVLLNRAEAAYELYTAGQSGANYLQDAYTQINDIRDRAGAVLLTGPGALNDINIIRNERRKELAFENKIFWDIKRWRTADKEINNRDWFVLNPIYVAANGKYIFDKRKWEGNAIFTFNVNQYYEAIPTVEIGKDPKLVINL
jgi:hypothetical protein